MSAAQQPNNKRTLAEYCQLFSELKVSNSRQRGGAPYKPILLLSIIDLITQGFIDKNEITVSDELIDTFNKYWEILGNSSYSGGLHYPFIHLQSDSFWKIEFQPDFNGLQPKTVNKLKQAVQYAKLDDELFDLIKNNESRQELVDTLISVWFSDFQRKLEDILYVNQVLQDESNQELEVIEQEIEKKFRVYKSLVRNALFRKSIVHIYDYKCAFCGLRVTRSINQSIVDGAHIKPFSIFYDNKVDNGISFCKNHHWAFDRGWFTIDENYKILVCRDLQESTPNCKPMQEFHGITIFLPASEIYFPRIESLKWHNHHIFKP